MIDISFMGWFASLLAIRYIFTFISIAVVTIFVYKGYKAFVEDRITPRLVLASILSASAIILVGAFLFTGTIAPKGTIDIPYKAAPIQENIEIVTPPPRTEKLEGFTPMKVDN